MNDEPTENHEKPTSVVFVRMTKSDHDAIKAAAAEEKMSVNQYCAEVLVTAALGLTDEFTV